MNATTVAFLRDFPIPFDLQPYESAIKRLPVPVIITIVGQCELNGFTSSEIGAALMAAADFGELEQHRCASCYRWVSRDDAQPCATMVFEHDETDTKRIVHYAFCPRCYKRVMSGQVDKDFATRLRNYVCG